MGGRGGLLLKNNKSGCYITEFILFHMTGFGVMPSSSGTNCVLHVFVIVMVPAQIQHYRKTCIVSSYVPIYS